jgi:hypothetical protein
VSTAALALLVGSQGVTVALPAKAPTGGEFASSFESGDPAPDWLNTVDTAPDGSKRASGVDGGYSTGIPGNVTDHVTDVRASSENTGGGEVKENLVDGESGTKWLTFASTGWVEFDLDKPAKVVTYALTSANDFAERDPKDWTLSGLDGRQGLEDPGHPHRRDLRRPVPDEVVRPRRAGRVPALPARHHEEQRRERHPAARRRPVLDGRQHRPDPRGHALAGRPGPQRLAHREGGRRLHREAGTALRGPSHGHGAGVLVQQGLRRERAGRQGHALSYRIFPQMADGDLDYDATNVSVDLAFTDGTYLSDLGATDSHGFALTPQGQGAAKILYVNQWNNVLSRIGSVAAGKTVDRILVAYDSPSGPRSSGAGWTT